MIWDIHLEAAQDSTYSVAWLDCLSIGDGLGRSLVMLGEHAKLGDLPKKESCKGVSGCTKAEAFRSN